MTRAVHRLMTVQFQPERQARSRIEEDPKLREKVEWGRTTFGVSTIRRQLLADAVRINDSVLPDLDAALRDVASRSQLDLPVEAFVIPSPHLNAAVLPSSDGMTVVLSSTAIERLVRDELDFVIGHELGHAAFGHLDLPAAAIVSEGGGLNPRHAMQLMAWQRQSEISADRAGLVCCGSIETAAKAMFKTMSGLTLDDLSVDPYAFSNQWDDLCAELSRDIQRGHWSATHPFPPLRMRALLLFSQTREAGFADSSIELQPLPSVDAGVERMLGMLNPLARESGDDSDDGADPMLREFFLWGGLYIAAADGAIDRSELDKIGSLVDSEAIAAVEAEGFESAAEYRDRFTQAKDNRQNRLTGLEIQRIFSGLTAIIQADGHIHNDEIAALQDLAESLGISGSYVQTLL